ncbi:MAG: type I restriction enzyme HsdR N-terminal domain-containing protein [Chloroflexi bacterium]|nr:type I restriction enzyme HsdR N-terminal domain-containing protein [Chloroflexota bacterium]
MPPKPIYEIDPKTYLFGKSLSISAEEANNKRRKFPEEKVRQWTLFELMTSYGYLINDLKIEVPSKMGSGYHPADIVVYQDHRPFIVIECKKIGNNKTDEAIKQAITYATGLKTEFAVYTDGENWIVRRFVSGFWVEVVDIPATLNLNKGKTALNLFLFIDKLKPLLFWTHKSIPAAKVRKYFSYFEDFIFTESFNFLGEINGNLLLGAQHISKIMSGPVGEQGSKIIKNEYNNKNLLVAVSLLRKYMGEVGVGGALVKDVETVEDKYYTFEKIVELLNIELSAVAMNYINTAGEEFFLLRLTISVLRYLHETLRHDGILQDVSSSTTHEFYSLVNLILITQLNVELPDVVNLDGVQALEQFSSSMWFEKNQEN